MGDNLLNLGNQINVPLHVDEDGYFGRECPVKECLGYFKVTLGTGIKGPASYHCPYCGHSGEHETFYTQEQIDYAITKGLRSFVSFNRWNSERFREVRQSFRAPAFSAGARKRIDNAHP